MMVEISRFSYLVWGTYRRRRIAARGEGGGREEEGEGEGEGNGIEPGPEDDLIVDMGVREELVGGEEESEVLEGEWWLLSSQSKALRLLYLLFVVSITKLVATKSTSLLWDGYQDTGLFIYNVILLWIQGFGLEHFYLFFDF